MSYRLLCILLTLLLLPHGRALASPLVLDTATPVVDLAGIAEVLEDRGGAMTVADVAHANPQFRPTRPDMEINFGYSPSAYWLRFTLPAGVPRDLLLEVAYPTLDQVDLYAPEGDGFRVMVAGDMRPAALRVIANRNFVFPLTVAPEAPRTYYLRVASAGSVTIPALIWQHDAFSRHSALDYAGLALYFGIFIALAFYNLMLFLSLRDRLFLTYVAFVTSLATGLASQSGLANDLLWPHWTTWGNLAFPGGIALAGLFGCLFTREFLSTARITPLLDHFLVMLAAIFAITAVALPFVSYRTDGMLITLTGIIFCVTAFAAGVWYLAHGHYSARYFLLAWSLLLVATIVMSLRNFGWLPSNIFTRGSMQVASAIEMLLLSFALADRYNQMRRDKEQAQADALIAKQTLVESLRQSEQALEHRVVERTRELEEANAKLRDDERMLKEMAHHDPLTGLANRILLEMRLEHAIARALRSGDQLAVMLLDLDGFKPVNDTLGHAAGDQLLVEVARRLSAMVRSSDTVARLGGDEFVVVLEPGKSVEATHQVAQKLVAAIAEPLQLAGKEARISVSLGIAMLTGDTTPEEFLLQADAAMYRAKSQGGNRVHQ